MGNKQKRHRYDLMSKGAKRPIDWCRYTNFRSRKTKNDLTKLCSSYSRSELDVIFSTADERGLCPIHWAAVHNRSDLIECLIDQGQPVRIRCRNKLFADCSPLHLASMNGSIEAAAVMLRRCPRADQSADVNKACVTEWLRERDLDGQTALMRAAAPRSKRLDTIRDLLQKNLWSLGARPAEMALFLINFGADWRETDSMHGMNLLHLAIINDYDDIVYMLLAIDTQLASTTVQIKPQSLSREPNTSNSRSHNESPTSTDSDQSDNILISERERAAKLVTSGLSPLQLAILYGRFSVIEILWRADKSGSSTGKDHTSPIKSRSDLRRVVERARWLDRGELKRISKSATLQFLLGLDVAILTLVWCPIYLSNQDQSGRSLMLSIRGGFFIISYCLALALTLRVMLKSPGHLKRNTVQYFTELKDLARLSGAKEKDAKVNDGTIEIDLESIEKEVQNKLNMPVEERIRLLCHRCRCTREMRSRHCNTCKRCIREFDHHCIYLGCCIGKKNRLDFLLLHIMLFLTAIYGTWIYLTSAKKSENGFWDFIGLLWIVKYVIIGGVNSIQVLRRACLGVTLYESMRADRIRSIFGSQGPPDEISRSHRIYARERNSFWRYPPDRFMSGDLAANKMIENLREFASHSQLHYYITSLAGSSEQLISPEKDTGKKSNSERLHDLV